MARRTAPKRFRAKAGLASAQLAVPQLLREGRFRLRYPAARCGEIHSPFPDYFAAQRLHLHTINVSNREAPRTPYGLKGQIEIENGYCKKQAVYPVKDAPMARQKGATVLQLRTSLEKGFHEITNLTENTYTYS